jgi:hypothetical protein
MVREVVAARAKGLQAAQAVVEVAAELVVLVTTLAALAVAVVVTLALALVLLAAILVVLVAAAAGYKLAETLVMVALLVAVVDALHLHQELILVDQAAMA